MSLRRRRRSGQRASDPQVAPDGFQIRGGYSVTGLLRTVGCVMGPCSLARLAGTLPPHADLVRGSCFDLTRGSSFSCFGVRPATLANLSFELVPARCPCCNAACRQHKHGACHFSASSASSVSPRFLLAVAVSIVRRSLAEWSPRAILLGTGWIPGALDTGDVRPWGIGARA